MSVQISAVSIGDTGTRSIVDIPEGGAALLLPASREQVARTLREGDDLVVVLADGRELLVEAFFVRAGEGVFLLVRAGSAGEAATLEIADDGRVMGTEPVALGRLEEMFTPVPAKAGAAVGVSSAGSVVLDTWEAMWAGDTALITLGGIAAVAGIAVLLDDDDEDGGVDRDAVLAAILEDPSSDGVDAARFRAAGVTGVGGWNLEILKSLLGGLGDDERAELTRDGVQEFVALATILDNPRSFRVRTASLFDDAGVTGVDGESFETLRSLLDDLGDGGRAALTREEVQEFADLAAVIANPASPEFDADVFGAVDVTGVDSGNLEALRSLVGGLDEGERRTLTLQDVQGLVGLAAVLVDPASTEFGADVFDAAGVTGVDENNLEAVKSTLQSLEADDRVALDRGQTQALVDIVVWYVPSGALVDADFRVDAGFGAGRVILDIDFDGDGTDDRRVELDVARDLNPTMARLHLDLDGSVDQIESYRLDASGRREAALFDVDADGTWERIETYGEDAEGNRIVRYDDDASDDGTSERIEAFAYDGEGRVERILHDYDASDDGGYERSVTYTHRDTEFDAAFDEDNDGTTDAVATYTIEPGEPGSRRTAFYNHDDRDIVYDDALDGVVRGRVTKITFDDDLTDDGSVERIESYTYDTLGRVEGVYVDSEAPADGTGDDELLVTLSYDDSDRVSRIVYDDGVDGTNDLTVDIVYNARGLAERLTHTAPLPGVGATVIRVERYTEFNERGEWLRRETDHLLDGAVDGTADLVVEREYIANARLWFEQRSDGDVDGTMFTLSDGPWDEIEQRTYTGVRKNMEQRWRDWDADGNWDVVHTFRYAPGRADGAWERLRIDDDTDDDGTVNRVEYRYDNVDNLYGAYDDDQDGDIDGIRLFRDHTLEPDVARASEWAGLESVAMGPNGGAAVAGTLVVTDAALSALAGGEAGYSLQVMGEADDTLQISGDGIVRDASADTTDAGNGYEAYRGTDGVILVDSDITVYGAYDRDDDGAIDGIRLLADRTLEPDVARASGWAGLESVAMGPSGGTEVAGTLVITDAALSALAGGEAGYSLLVTGEADDTLQIKGGGIARAASDDTTQDGNDYHAYQGTDGMILVDSEIAVEMSAA